VNSDVDTSISTGTRRKGSKQDSLVRSRAFIWLAIFIGSTIGGAVPELWGGEMLSYTSLLLSGIGGLIGLWIVIKM
jgi:predicted MFS family arabinose efflux permease